MTTRLVVLIALLGLGVAAQSALEAGYQTPRPRLKQPLSTIPLRLGRWVGRDEPMDPRILRETQADDYVNRVYEDTEHPGRKFELWINYSLHGLNLRHSPEICLPSGGWTKIESRTRVLKVERPGGAPMRISKLGYGQSDLVQDIGFWYYIFGEGPFEHFARSLPIASRSSHGRTTRGSGLTVEVFYPGQSDPGAEAFPEFAAELLDALEPLLPEDRASYHIP
jgi:hypothetical protein